jgi:hypothetical protein
LIFSLRVFQINPVHIRNRLRAQITVEPHLYIVNGGHFCNNAAIIYITLSVILIHLNFRNCVMKIIIRQNLC